MKGELFFYALEAFVGAVLALCRAWLLKSLHILIHFICYNSIGFLNAFKYRVYFFGL